MRLKVLQVHVLSFDNLLQTLGGIFYIVTNVTSFNYYGGLWWVTDVTYNFTSHITCNVIRRVFPCIIKYARIIKYEQINSEKVFIEN